jgi:deoxyribonuclease-4
MRAFDRIIGVKRLKGAHLNDSRKDYQGGTDRHELIGKGKIGLSAFRSIMNDRRFEDIPLILETPDRKKWKREIKLLYSLQSR